MYIFKNNPTCTLNTIVCSRILCLRDFYLLDSKDWRELNSDCIFNINLKILDTKNI